MAINGYSLYMAKRQMEEPQRLGGFHFNQLMGALDHEWQDLNQKDKDKYGVAFISRSVSHGFSFHRRYKNMAKECKRARISMHEYLKAKMGSGGRGGGHGGGAYSVASFGQTAEERVTAIKYPSTVSVP